MLTRVDNLDEINKALCQTSGWIALDLSNGNYLSKASDPGSAQNSMDILRIRYRMAIVIWADNDREALNKANYK